MEEENIEVFEDADGQKDKYMIFVSGGENYGISITNVNEIVGLTRITEVPETAAFIRGLINLRGRIIPVIDVRMRFGMEPLEYNDRTCVIVVTVDKVVVGLIVDKILEVRTVDKADIVEPPSVVNGAGRNRFVYGIVKTGEEVIMLIEPTNLISEEEQEELGKLA